MKTTHTLLAGLSILSSASLLAEEQAEQSQQQSAAANTNLQDQLDARRAAFEESAPEEKVIGYNQGVELVRESGIIDDALNVGDTAPEFTLDNHNEEEVSLESLLEDGPVVMTWYRGSWCPYCNLALRAYQENLPAIEDEGAQFVALTPELPDNSIPTAEKLHLEYQVLTDLNNQVADQFGIVFNMSDYVTDQMREFAGLNEYNGEEYDDTTLPLSATYIIDTDGTIIYAFLDAEYRNRATPEAIIEALQQHNASASE